MGIKDQLKSAIDAHISIEIFYKDDQEGRKVNPYHYGIFGGKDHLHAYQISGISKSGKPQSWKHFLLSDISNIKMTTDKFFPPDKGYNSEAPHYKVEYQIQYDGMKRKAKP